MYSVIIPTAKASKTLDLAVKSVLLQSIPPDEVLIVLNNSDRETASLVDKLSRENPIINAIEANVSNVSDAMNIGIDRARSGVIMRMDSDDLMERNRAELQLEVLSKGYSVVGGSIRAFGNSRKSWIVHSSSEYLKTLALFASPLPGPTLAFRNNSKLRYISGLNMCDDMAFLLRAIQNGFDLAATRRKVLKYRVHGSSMTNGKLTLAEVNNNKKL